MPTDLEWVHNLPDSLTEFDFAPYGMQAGAEMNGKSEASTSQVQGLSDWYYDNQQIMNVLDENMI